MASQPLAVTGLYRETLKRARTGEFVRASPGERARAVAELIRTSSSAAAVVALQPIPFVDVATLTPMQRRMVQSIALVHGYALDDAGVRDMFRTFRQRIMASHLTMAAAKLIPLVPVIPTAFAVSVAYALTCALGEASHRYFVARKLIPDEEMKTSLDVIYRDTLERAFRAKRNELRALFRDPRVRREIDALKKARRDGKIGEVEAERRMEEVLGKSPRAPTRHDRPQAP